MKFATHLEKVIQKNGGEFYYGSEVLNLSSNINPQLSVRVKSKIKTFEFDAIVVTLPSPLFVKISPDLPKSYTKKLHKLKGIGALNLVLRMKKPFFLNNTYWLSMCDLASPILAIVEHTNFMNKKNYDNEHIIYIGNYMETSDPRFTMNENQLLKLYDPWLKKINPSYKQAIINSKVFKAPFAQPIIPINYSKDIPSFKTPLKNVYLSNIQQVYPWDRGTNYAVQLGKKVSELISRDE